jgi:ABC-2 type transport system permease protein
MKLLDIALKDLKQIFRDKNSALFLVVMPIVFTLFMGYAYRSGDNGNQTGSKIPLAWVEPETKTILGNLLLTRLEDSGNFEIQSMDLDTAQDRLQKGKVDGILLVPADFDLLVQDDQNPQFTLVTSTDNNKGQALYQILRTPLTQLMSAAEIGRINAELQADDAEFQPAVAFAWEKWAANNTSDLILMEKAVVIEEESWFGDNPYNQASPGIIVQFAIIGLITSAQILVEERKTRTLHRQMTTAMHTWEIISGHLLAMFALVFMQTMLMILFGQLVLHVNYLRVPLGILLLSIALGLWIASMGLLIGVLAKSDNQVVLFSMLAMFILSALGGTWFPIDVAGSTFNSISQIFPSTWAMIGLQNILMRGLDLSSLWRPIIILLVYALGFFLLGIWRFRKSEM